MNNPAVLWYPSDFISSTIFWNNEQCGAYIRLLNYQFTLGHLKKEQLEQITTDKIVLEKFIEDEDGLFYNPRMEKEIEKRRNYSLSRSKNKLGKTKSYDNDMEDTSKLYDIHMGNRNRNINENINIIDYFSNNIHSIVQREYEDITKWEETFTDDIIKEAIDEAILHNARNMKYINSILRNWKEKGYKTIDDIKNNSINKNNKTEPEWMNKKIDSEQVSDDELEELEKEMSIFEN